MWKLKFKSNDMRCGLIAKKIGMTRSFSKEGVNTPVTILKLENVQVTAVLDKVKNGYTAVQVGAGTIKSKNVTKPLRGHFAKAKVEPKKILREFIVSEDMMLKIGDTFSVNHFSVGQKVDVSGVSIGKGFSGGMKRHNFAGLEATHGVSVSHRSHGSTGNSQDPGKVWKGKKMAGQYGNVNKTVQSLTIVDFNEEHDLIYVKGSVPGSKESYVTIRDAIKSKLPEEVIKPAGLKNELNNVKEQENNNENLDKNDESLSPNDEGKKEEAIKENDVSSEELNKEQSDEEVKEITEKKSE